MDETARIQKAMVYLDEIYEDHAGTLCRTTLSRWTTQEQVLFRGSKRWSKEFVPLVTMIDLLSLRNCILDHVVTICSGSLTDTYDEIKRKSTSIGIDISLIERCMTEIRLVTSSADRVSKKTYFQRRINKISESVENNVSNIIIVHMAELQNIMVLLLRLKDSAEEIQNTKFVLLFLGNSSMAMEWKNLSKTFGRLCMNQEFFSMILLVDDNIEICHEMDSYIRRSSLIALPQKKDRMRMSSTMSGLLDDKGFHSLSMINIDEVIRSGQCGLQLGRKYLLKGLIEDIRNRRKYYCQDFKDALDIQIVTSFIFMYFACLTPIITFGGLLSKATDGNLGTIESLLSGCISGVIFALFSGQPMIILGSTGPILVFESIIYQFCKSQNLSYLSFRLWIGLWIALFIVTIVIFNLNNIIRYITKFTEEIFATLISVIFIYEAVMNLVHSLQQYPIKRTTSCNENFTSSRTPQTLPMHLHTTVFNGTVEAQCYQSSNVFFWSLILATVTFGLPMIIRKVDHLKLFWPWLRDLITNCAVISTIFILTMVDHYLEVHSVKLTIPERFEPSLGYEIRGWLIPFFSTNPLWVSVVAVFPAILFVILIFLDQQITAVIINKDKCLRKGGGYNLDLLVLAVILVINSFIGIPWFVAATVLSMNHVESLKTKSDISQCREQRVTGILIAITIGVSVLLTPILKMVPMAILYGVFILMGVTSLTNIEFIKRLGLIFIPQIDHPDYRFLRKIPTRKVHLFTIIQLVSFSVLWVVKSIKIVSVTFPLMIVVICLIRLALGRIFSAEELYWLDDLYPGTKVNKKEMLEGEEEEARIVRSL